MYIRTVLGNITPEELGITLGHEPLLIDLRGLWDNPPTIPSLWWLGRDHLLSNIVPRLRHAGVSQQELDVMFIETPRRLLTFSD